MGELISLINWLRLYYMYNGLLCMHIRSKITFSWVPLRWNFVQAFKQTVDKWWLIHNQFIHKGSALLPAVTVAHISPVVFEEKLPRDYEGMLGYQTIINCTN